MWKPFSKRKPAQPPPAPPTSYSVLPLEWSEKWDVHRSTNRLYVVEKSHVMKEKWYVLFANTPLRGEDGACIFYDTLDLAQIAAQAHFDAFIGASVTPRSEPETFDPEEILPSLREATEGARLARAANPRELHPRIAALQEGV